jgi:uncharacterized RDD family membrane protein YckC
MARREKPLDTTIEIVTPENIAFEYRLAGPFRRLPAFLIDFLLRIAVWMILAIILSLFDVTFSGDGTFTSLVLIAAFLMEWLYGGVMETYWNGQTIGKMLMRIRVISADGQPINALQAMMRNFLRFADMMPMIPLSALSEVPTPVAIPTFGFALIVPLLNSRFQRLGDIVCGTMVVVEEKSDLFEAPKFEDPRVSQLAAELPPSFVVSRTLARALATYVDRRALFSAARRREIAEHLAKPLLKKFGLPADTSYDLLLCSLYHRTFLSADEDYEVLPLVYTAAGQHSQGNPFSVAK